MTVLVDGLTTSVTMFAAPPPPQPATASSTRALRLSKSMEHKLRDFITTRTPKIPFFRSDRGGKKFLAISRSINRYS